MYTQYDVTKSALNKPCFCIEAGKPPGTYKRITSVVLFVTDAAGYIHLHQHTRRVCVAARGPYRGETMKGDVLVALDWGCMSDGLD